MMSQLQPHRHGDSKFVEEAWQRHDIISLLMKHDAQASANGGTAGTANWSEMGCISGDARLTILTASGKVTYPTLSEAYVGFNKLHSDKRKNWKSSEPYKTLAYCDGRIRHNEIIAITASGPKECVRITLENKRTLDLTADHLVLTYGDTWVEAGNLVSGDLIVNKGGKGAKHNSKRDGYKYVYMKQKHTSGTRVEINGSVYWKVPEHRLVAETPKDMHTHHKDETSRNNDPENLSVITLSEHSRTHALDQIASYDAPPAKVVSIEHVGIKETFDITMKAPYHNFVVNGIVVHNCYKTSTGLWFIERKINEAKAQGKLKGEHPSILIISNKSGKGTFFEAVPEIFKGWTFLNIETNRITVFINGKEMNLKGLKYCPKQFGMPTVCITHYNVFSFSNRGQFEEDETGRPIKDENGKFILKPWRQADYIIDHEWDFVWTDEFHRMKDKDSRWTVGIKKLKTTVGRHGSTGTGFINRPNEIWSLLNWLDKKKYPSYWDFHTEFCDIDEDDGYAKVAGVKPEKKDEFRKLVRDIGVRRTLDHTHPDIEKVVFSPVNVELNPTQRKMYNEIRSELQTLDQNGVALFSANVLSLLQRLRQICVGTPEVVADYYDEALDRRVQKIKLREPSSKLDAVMEVLEGLQWDEEKKEPLVVFSCFKDPLELLKVRLEKHNDFILSNGLDESLTYPYLHMDVSDGDSERYRKWHDEFPTMKYRVFMSTLQLGGESINLTPAHHLIFLDRSWSPKDNNQGIGRIRRPGQTSVPVVININALNTTDRYIEQVNDIKNGWFKTIFADD